MKIKIMCPNNRGNIELKKEDLEQLLNEAYAEGYSDGSRSHSYPYTLYGYQDNSISTSPKITCNGDVVYTTATNSINLSDELSSSATTSTGWVSGKTETIEFSNVAGIGVVKTNEV